MAKAKEFKPSKKFLQKVADGGVYNKFRYSARKGGQHSFVGGEKSYKDHCRMGFVTPAPVADLGRPGVVMLTDKGRAILDADKAAAAPIQEAIERGRDWFLRHRDHVLKVMGGCPRGIQPEGEDLRNPALWKDIHWRWFFDRRAA